MLKSLNLVSILKVQPITRGMASLNLTKAFIDGTWTDSRSKETFDVLNPATGDVVGTVPDMGVEETKSAISAAKKAFHSSQWASLTAKQRSTLLKKWYSLLEENRDQIAEIMTCECGKPINESQGEITYGNSFVEWFAEEARRIYGEIIPAPQPNRELLVIRQPIGVVALITPWNFPHAMITRKAGAALAAGCTVVMRPSEDTPLTALALTKLAEEAGFPPGVINIVTSSRKNAGAIGELLCKSPDVAGLSFTGSTEVGKILFRNCADGIKRLALELGGNAPFIVFNSADIEKAVDGAMTSKFRNGGQTCVASNRFLIQEKIYDKFLSQLTERVRKLKIGDGMDSSVEIGPLVNEMQFGKINCFVEDAKSKGANIVLGGNPLPKLGKLFYEPTIAADLKPNMDIYNEEVFGPIISIIKFKEEDEAIKIANSTQRGLAAYFYSSDVQQVFRVARKLEFGMVGINEGLISTTEAPFGGVKQSGIGREGSRHGIDEYVYTKYLCLGNMK